MSALWFPANVLDDEVAERLEVRVAIDDPVLVRVDVREWAAPQTINVTGAVRTRKYQARAM